jgi:hypothetical protein
MYMDGLIFISFNFTVFHTSCVLPWLTERQGCCPVCKTPVLPDEMQRSQARSPQQGLQSISLGRRRWRHQPQSAPTSQLSERNGQEDTELESDLDSAYQLNTSGGFPSSAQPDRDSSLSGGDGERRSFSDSA